MENNVLTVRYAGFWIRTLASLLDTLWQLPLVLIPLWFVFKINLLDPSTSHHPAVIFCGYILPFLVYLYFWSKYAATPGKILFNLKIVDQETLLPADFSQLVIRYISYYISAFILFLGFFWVGWDAKKQGFHDKIAKTVVIISEDE